MIKKYQKLIKKEPENNMRSMKALLSQSIDKVPEIDKKISQAELIKSFLIHINFVMVILISLLYY